MPVAQKRCAKRPCEEVASGGAAAAAGALGANVLDLRGVGPAMAARLAAAGVRRIGQLLEVLPCQYIDLRRERDLGDLEACVGEQVVVRGALDRVSEIPTRRRGLRIVRARLRNTSGTVPCIWFNQPYLAKTLRQGEGEEFLLYGTVTVRRGVTQVQNARVTSSARGIGGLEVVYPKLGEVGAGLVARLVTQALDRLEAEPAALIDPLPEAVRKEHGLPSLREAFLEVHRPPTDLEAEQVQRLCEGAGAGHRRLLFDQLVGFQLGILCRHRVAENRDGVGRSPRQQTKRYRIDENVREHARNLLPFRLTPGQREAVRAIVKDMRSPRPMLRLVQGDVGCGKTAVAALAALVAADSGLQAAFLAPTELLAEQHAVALRALFAQRHEVALVTSASNLGERDLSSPTAPRLVVGTHALLSESVRFDRLALVVIDEQHRFGVAQRELMVARAEQPDVLILTATPIPRSMALFLYGDLDSSTIRELPAGRLEVETEVLAPQQRSRALARLRRELEQGGQAFVVFPRIREGEGEGVSLEALEPLYRRELEPFACAVVSGESPREERQERLARFHAGDLGCLLATTVIEVGVDVPNASAMVIEGAERFGLAQLHQLRGRVGRGPRPSICMALAEPTTPEGEQRLEAFAATSDGFELAELDLRIRGPGQLLGSRQSGGADRLLLRALDEGELLTHSRSVASRLWERARRAPASRSGAGEGLLRSFGVDPATGSLLGGG